MRVVPYRQILFVFIVCTFITYQLVRLLTPRNTQVNNDPLRDYIIHQLLHDHHYSDAFDITMRMRMFKASPVNDGIYKYLEKRHFSWLPHPVQQLPSKQWTQQRGIVICTGNVYFRLAVHLIKQLRYHKCTLPVAIFHNGDADLSRKKQRYFTKKMANVLTVDISTVFKNERGVQGWDMKPFAVLFSPFKETLLMDADTVLLADPMQLFEDVEYRETGALFFKDRSLNRLWSDDFFVRIFPWPHSLQLTGNALSRRHSQHQQESGMVLIDKSRHLYGMLMVCLLNMPWQRNKGTIKDFIHGDKETFWMGLELMQEPYSFMPHNPGSIGQPLQHTNKTAPIEHTICGKLIHFQRDGQLFWMNDSILKDKHSMDWWAKMNEYEYYAVEGTWSVYLCLDTPLRPIPTRLLKVIDDLKRLYHPGPDRFLLNL